MAFLYNLYNDINKYWTLISGFSLIPYKSPKLFKKRNFGVYGGGGGYRELNVYKDPGMWSLMSIDPGMYSYLFTYLAMWNLMSIDRD